MGRMEGPLSAMSGRIAELEINRLKVRSTLHCCRSLALLRDPAIIFVIWTRAVRRECFEVDSVLVLGVLPGKAI